MITLTSALTIAMVLTIIGLVCACIRLTIGPSRADRVVSLDLITILLVAIAAQLAMLYEVSAYLDVGLAIGLIGFLATVAFARFIETAATEQSGKETELAAAHANPVTTGPVDNSSESEVSK